jgi:hypothetical protein
MEQELRQMFEMKDTEMSVPPTLPPELRNRIGRQRMVMGGLVAATAFALVLGGSAVRSMVSIDVPPIPPAGGRQAPAPSATPSPTVPAGTVPIEPGTYRIPESARSVADYTVTVPEGWTVQHGHVLLKHSDAPDELSFFAVVLDAIYADACAGGNELMEVGPSVDDLAAALLQQPGPAASGPVDTTLGGYPAKRIDLTVPEGFDPEACRPRGVGLQIWYTPLDDYFVLLPDGIVSVYIVDVDGRRQVFVAQYRSRTSDKDVREMQAVLDSIRIET